jgi:hypothetical protein
VIQMKRMKRLVGSLGTSKSCQFSTMHPHAVHLIPDLSLQFSKQAPTHHPEEVDRFFKENAAEYELEVRERAEVREKSKGTDKSRASKGRSTTK